MSKRAAIERVETGVPNLDDLLLGGLPKGSVSVVSGPPGSGKTILTQQFCFRNASAKSGVLVFGTLSEPTAKTLRHLRQFSFFDQAKMKTRGSDHDRRTHVIGISAGGMRVARLVTTPLTDAHKPKPKARLLNARGTRPV